MYTILIAEEMGELKRKEIINSMVDQKSINASWKQISKEQKNIALIGFNSLGKRKIDLIGDDVEDICLEKGFC